MDENKIYLTQEGYEQYIAEIEKLHEKLGSSSKDKSESYRSAVGDGWHDNFAFENAKREELMVIKELEEKLARLGQIVIIDEIDDPEIIGINSVVRLTVQLPSGRQSEQFVKLVGTEKVDIHTSPKEVSLNSPLGQAIYQSKVGEVVNYSVNGNDLVAIIEEKIDEREMDNENQQRRLQK